MTPEKQLEMYEKMLSLLCVSKLHLIESLKSTEDGLKKYTKLYSELSAKVNKNKSVITK
jgi:hypothetical protein